MGVVAPILVVGSLFSFVFTEGEPSSTRLGFALASIALLLATGRVCRETASLLRRPAWPPTSARALIADRPRRLRTVNKRWGHAAGDRLLEGVARAIEGKLRADDVLGRIGGDEFAALVVSGPHLLRPGRRGARRPRAPVP